MKLSTSIALFIFVFFVIPSSVAQINKAIQYQKQGEYTKAMETAEATLVKRRNAYNANVVSKPLFADDLRQIANIYYWNGYYKKADDIFVEADKVLQEANLSDNRVLIDWANVKVGLGDYMTAEELAVKVFSSGRIYRSVSNNPPDLQDWLAPIAVVMSIGSYDTAEKLFNQVLEHYSGISDKKYKLNLIGGFGNLNDYEKVFQTSRALNELMSMYLDTGQYGKAERSANLMYELWNQKTGNNQVSVGFKSFLAHFYALLGNFEKSKQVIDETETLVKAEKMSLDGKNSPIANYLGMAYFEIGIPDKARPLLEHANKESGERSRDVFTRLNVVSAECLSSIYLQSKEYAKAEAVLQRAMDKLSEKKMYLNEQLIQDGLYADLLFYQAIVYLQQKQYERSEQLLTRVISNRNRTSLIAKAQLNLAFLYQKTGRNQEAYTNYKKALDTSIEFLNKNIYAFTEKERGDLLKEISRGIQMFNLFVYDRYAIIPASISDAFDYQLAIKSLLFNSSRIIADKIAASNDAVLKNSYNHFQAERLFLTRAYAFSDEQLKEQNINLKALEEEASQHERELVRKVSGMFLLSERVTLHWTDIQKKLRPGEAAVEFVRLYDIEKNSIKYMAIVVNSEQKQPQLIPFDNGSLMEGRYYSYYSNAIKSKVDDDLSYEQFWKPLAAVLKNVKKVYVAGDGTYNRINLNTLRNPATGKYVVDEIEVQAVTSTRDLTILKPTVQRSRTILMGSPAFKSQQPAKGSSEPSLPGTHVDSLRSFLTGDIADLPGTRAELSNVEKCLVKKQIKPEVFTGTSANEETVKALSNVRILHLATHGFFYSNPKGDDDFLGYRSEVLNFNPLLLSGLLLSNAQNSLNGERNPDMEDGILTAQEALNLQLENTELVVLSACETGQGKVINGEGVYGLQRAFQMSGANAVIMSLWKVDDQATSELMTNFYTDWIVNGVEKRKAFQNASKKVRIKYKHPNYWGAFVMIGG